MRITSCSGSAREDFGDFEESQLVEMRTRLRTGRVDFPSSLRPDEFVCYWRHTCWEGAGGKARIERMCISLLMSKNL